MTWKFAATVGLAVTLASSTPLSAAGDFEATIVIKDHKFVPADTKVPAGQRITITVDNQDPTPEEFESHEFNVEKVVPGNSKAKVRVAGLAPGVFHFFGEFNEATAQGTLTAE